MNKQKMATGERHSAPKTLHHLEVKEAENGGHMVTHHFNNSGPGEYHQPEEHVFGADEGDKAAEHIMGAANIKFEPSGGAEQPEAAEKDEEAEG
jgi:hypothetical protein